MRTTVSAVIAVLTFASPTFAQDTGLYLKAFGGLSAQQADRFNLAGTDTSLSFDNGTLFGGAIGYAYPDRNLRAEVEFNYRRSEADAFPAGLGTGADFGATSLMVNGYYMFNATNGFTPYVGAGVGYLTEIDFDIQGGTGATEYNDRGGVTMQAIAGAEYDLNDRMAVFAELRYFKGPTTKMTNTAGQSLEADFSTLDANIGLTVKF